MIHKYFVKTQARKKRFLQKECHPILISLSMYVARCLRIKSLSSKPDFAQH